MEGKSERLGRIRRALLPLAGFGALLWFLIRVIPKPSRARYPCMQAAAPLASSFVIGILAFLSSIALFRSARSFMYRSRYLLLGLCLSGGAVLGIVSFAFSAAGASASPLPAEKPEDYAAAISGERPENDGPNMPMGIGKGIHPGRVVWTRNPAATNEKYDGKGPKLWFDESNAPQKATGAMLEKGILKLTGKASVKEAWDALFRFTNKSRGLGDHGYRNGETIVVKANFNGWSRGRQNINTSPQVLYALLDQLVNQVGVPQARIHLGEPNIDIDKVMYASVLKAFPKVKYYKSPGQRKPSDVTKGDAIFASDGKKSDPLPKSYADASYMINVPVLKKHHRAGISITAKLHFGSITPFNGNGAFDWHYSLPAPYGGANVSNGGYGKYRCFVDFMGHKDLGGKTVLYLVDALWSSTNWGHPAARWRMSPFDGDYPSSLFLSQDPVAVDSVGYDFLYAEFDAKHPTEGAFDPRDDSGPFSRYSGADDYLHQAADPRNRPKGLAYDPEKDGVPITASLGVHEHWSDPVNKKYSGPGKGIDLLYIE